MRVSVFKVPLSRRIQTASVAAIVLFALLCLTVWLFCLFVPTAWVIYIPYVLIAFFIDKAPQKGGRLIARLRTASFWKSFSAYFPAQVVFHKEWTKNAKSDQQYIFALHPHGVVSMSVWANILSNGSGFYDQIPQLLQNLRIVTLPVNFFIPLWREFLLAMGMIDSNESSIRFALDRGNSVGIVIGGAAEALDAVPKKDYHLTLNNRRGFIRIAMKHGCAIVPVFSFGENDLFDQNTHPRLRKIQNSLKKFTGFSTPLFRGRGIFNYDFGLMPHRTPLTTIIGEPIVLKQNDNPTAKDLDEAHQLYTQQLRDLYYTYREQCGNANRELILV